MIPLDPPLRKHPSEVVQGTACRARLQRMLFQASLR